ncbi:unnamed protein product [Haemonchus placei]|uniref:Uncharacterized protein n=1 Tax=Haemonchus placei TaxID=6290 RepID=A0A0N4X2J0_HAEPC|nr:unnamed protein product [Haemonchus placei]
MWNLSVIIILNNQADLNFPFSGRIAAYGSPDATSAITYDTTGANFIRCNIRSALGTFRVQFVVDHSTSFAANDLGRDSTS